MNLFDKAPSVHREAFVAPSASIIGDVQVGHNSSIWYGCVLRGMIYKLLEKSSIQQSSAFSLSGRDFMLLAVDDNCQFILSIPS